MSELSPEFCFLMSEEVMDWSSLPKDVVSIVFRHLVGRWRDFLALRHTCRSFFAVSNSHNGPAVERMFDLAEQRMRERGDYEAFLKERKRRSDSSLPSCFPIAPPSCFP